MTDYPLGVSSNGVSFGPFRMSAQERLLENNGESVRIGGRAFDILVVLVESAGSVVGKKELLSRVWTDFTVDEGSLRFHIAELRKALGDGVSGARYITNVRGRGYCFVALIMNQTIATSPPIGMPAPAFRHNDLPPLLTRMVGRDQEIRTISSKLEACRFVTIVGPGGIGKTTVALAIAHNLRDTFDKSIHFLDLAQLNDPHLVSIAFASTFGLSVQSEDPLPGLVNFLRDQKCLIILDSCEHLIDAVAALAELLFPKVRDLYFLATSREPLQVEGEQVHRLHPLESPVEAVNLSAEDAMQFPAVQLFVERASANSGNFQLTDRDAPSVADICRKLDGIPLAIELTASRVEAFGIDGTATLLNDNIRLLWRGRRTALTRHRTLTAVLDWSYNLLTDIECLILGRLSIFKGNFTLEAIQFVASSDGITHEQILDTVVDLVAKSLISVVSMEKVLRYRLLDTTRTYAATKLLESGEANLIAARHAAYYAVYLNKSKELLDEDLHGEWLGVDAEHIGNARSALEWSFSASGEPKLAIALAVASAPLFLRMSLLIECYRWTERAIKILDVSTSGTDQELELAVSLGQSLMFTRGGRLALDALKRGLAVAEKLDSSYQKIRLLDSMRVFHVRTGSFQEALLIAQRSKEIVKDIADPVAAATSDWMLTNSYHLVGSQALAREHCRLAISGITTSSRLNIVHFGYDLRIASLCNYSRILCLQGEVAEALQVASQAIYDAQSISHSFTLCTALIWAIPVFLWSREWTRAHQNIEILSSHSKKYALGPYNAVALGFRGELLMKCDQPDEGLSLSRQALDYLWVKPYQNFSSIFATNLSEGLSNTGRFDEALTVIDHAIAEEEARGGTFYTPEILRMKGHILSTMPDAHLDEAEKWLDRSLDVSRRQSALSWELCTTISLAQLELKRDRITAARGLLELICDRFKDGEQFDLVKAKAILDDLKRGIPSKGGKRKR
jgi:predicted ATPase/DNA-binding winged helix-turn-helix (wHTH) protein